ncbi:MAG: LuxR C-terminal-related transcriptional regulator [Armatimonadetes bacterium]|jgi:DNA-binding NarL/FixJ family response regulator|nr:LuxR C-terminal-related transcriptional regulator [Armatimonadota bacterium]
MVVGIVCEDALTRAALAKLVESREGLTVLPSHADIRSTIGHYAKETPDVLIVLDKDLAPDEWVMISALKTLTSVRVICVTDGDAPRTDTSVDAVVRSQEGAEGLFRALATFAGHMPQAKVVAERRSDYGRRSRLTPREAEVAKLVAQGLPNRRIGQIMGLQEQSVKNLVSVVMRKLNCENRVQVALKMVGVLSDPALVD